MPTCSQPSNRKAGQRRSARMGAVISSPSEVRGAARLAASPTAKWPMNMRIPPSLPVGHSEQRELLLAFPQQQVAPGHAVPRHEGLAHVLHRFLVHVNPPLLDGPPGLALGCREAGAYPRLHEAG